MSVWPIGPPAAGERAKDISMGHLSRTNDIGMGHLSSSKDISMGHLSSTKDICMGHLSSTKDIGMGQLSITEEILPPLSSFSTKSLINLIALAAVSHSSS